MAVQVIISQQKGPLPVKATFNSPSSAPMYLEVTGSVWTTTANQLIGIGVKIDDQAIGSAQVFSNTASTQPVSVREEWRGPGVKDTKSPALNTVPSESINSPSSTTNSS